MASQNFTTGHFSLIILHSLTLDYFFSRLYNTCRGGGTGRHTGFKILRSQEHEGSTPSRGTKNKKIKNQKQGGVMAEPELLRCPMCMPGRIPLKNFEEIPPDGVIKAGEYRQATCSNCSITVVIGPGGKISFRPTPFGEAFSHLAPSRVTSAKEIFMTICPYCRREYTPEDLKVQIEGYESRHGEGSFAGDGMNCFGCKNDLWLTKERKLLKSP